MGKFLNISGVDTLSVALSHKLEEVAAEVIYQLSYIGERAVTYARQAHTNNWKDQTGNLRSSIGYVILQDGKPVVNSKIKQVKDGFEGVAACETLLNKLSSRYPKGITLILCAGMDYATYVENRGRDVLTGAKLLAESLCRKQLSGL